MGRTVEGGAGPSRARRLTVQWIGAGNRRRSGLQHKGRPLVPLPRIHFGDDELLPTEQHHLDGDRPYLIAGLDELLCDRDRP